MSKEVTFPINEIYEAVLSKGWKIRELWRKNGEIRLCVYCYNEHMEKFRVKAGLDFEDIKERLNHLEYSIYED